MGKPLVLKGFWNVRRLKKYRQKKLKIGRECGKNKKYYVNFQENIKWKQWKRQKSKNTFSNILAFSLKIVYRFRNNCIIHAGYSYFENNVLFLKKKQEYSKSYSCFFCHFHWFHFIFSQGVYIIFVFLPHAKADFNFFCRYFFNLLTFRNPFKINGFSHFFTCYFVDMLTLLLYYNMYSTFLLFYVEFRRIMA